MDELSWIISLVFLTLAGLIHPARCLNMLDSLRREHSLIKPYQGVILATGKASYQLASIISVALFFDSVFFFVGAGMSVPQWDFIGSTMVTNNFVRLTPDHQSKQGAIWNNVPCYATKWEFQVQFSVHGAGRDLYGDGFAIWYTKNRMQLGSVFGNQDLFSGLAVFLDTYNNHNGPHNHEHPYVSAMVGNGSAAYDHDRDGTHTQLSGCSAKFRGKTHPTHIAIRYEPNVLKVSLDIDGRNQWTECFRVEGVELPTGYYFGVSSATGDLSDNHDIVSLKFYDLDEHPDPNFAMVRSQIMPSAKGAEVQREHIEDVPPSKIGKVASSGLKIFGYIILGIIVCIILIFGGIFLYQYSKEDRRKRFY